MFSPSEHCKKFVCVLDLSGNFKVDQHFPFVIDCRSCSSTSSSINSFRLLLDLLVCLLRVLNDLLSPDVFAQYRILWLLLRLSWLLILRYYYSIFILNLMGVSGRWVLGSLGWTLITAYASGLLRGYNFVRLVAFVRLTLIGGGGRVWLLHVFHPLPASWGLLRHVTMFPDDFALRGLRCGFSEKLMLCIHFIIIF